MSTRYLGNQIDIHGGGRDLIFPHHPSEIAQTEAYTGQHPFVRFWMHGGLLWLDGDKMSKSLGNMVFVRDALRQHSADALRWYMLLSPYREDMHYDRSGPAAAERQVARLREALRAPSGPEPAPIMRRSRTAVSCTLPPPRSSTAPSTRSELLTAAR